MRTLLDQWLDVLGQGYDFNGQLDDIAGYDLIYIDYYTLRKIEDNADMLIGLLNDINNRIETVGGVKQQTVVLGIELGGLVARYALAKMTKDNIPGQPTNCRLLITHDAPHQGAYMPLGYQHLVEDFGGMQLGAGKFRDIIDNFKEYNALKNSPIFNELYMHTVVNGLVQTNNFLSHSNTAANSYHSMVNFISGGPQPTYQFIATSQGSQCGSSVLTPGTTMMKFEDEIQSFNVYSYTKKVGKIKFKIGFIPVWIDLKAQVSLDQKYKLKLKVNALPSGSSKEISKSQLDRVLVLKTKFKICPWSICFTVGSLKLATTTINVYSYSRNSPSGMQPFESYAGGTDNLETSSFKITQFIEPPTTSIAGIPVNGANVNVPFYVIFSKPTYSYVSRVSALDIANSVEDDYTRMLVQPINGLSRSRANKYICQEPVGGAGSSTVFNLASGRFTKRNANWMFNEMQGINSTTLQCEAGNACLLINNNFKIEGVTPICSSSTFTISNLTQNASVDWSYHLSSGAVSEIKNNNTITLTKVNDGIIHIGAMVNSSVCSPTISIPVSSISTRIGIPPAVAITSFNSAGTNRARAIATPIPLANYNWYEGIILPGFPPVLSATTTTNSYTVDAPCREGKYLSVASSNACGESTISTRVRYKRDCRNNTLFPVGPCAYTPRPGVYCMVVEPSHFDATVMEKFFNRISPFQEVIRSYEVINDRGEMVLERNEINAQITEIDLTDFADGAYTIIVKGSTDYVEQHLLNHSRTHSEEQIAEEIASGNLYASNTASADVINVLRQQLFHQIELNPEMINNSPVLQTFYLNSQNGAFGRIDDINNALNNHNVGEAQTLMQGWIPTTTLEYNCYSYYNYFIRFLLGETFTTSDVNGIYALANKCPQTNGEIIHAARSLYNFIANDTDEFEYACNPAVLSRGIKKPVKKINTEVSSTTIYPNPSTGNFNIKFSSAARGIYTIKVVDIYGKTVLTETCLAGVRNINLNSLLSKGLYHVQITSNTTGKTETHKLLIQ